MFDVSVDEWDLKWRYVEVCAYLVFGLVERDTLEIAGVSLGPAKGNYYLKKLEILLNLEAWKLLNLYSKFAQFKKMKFY